MENERFCDLCGRKMIGKVVETFPSILRNFSNIKEFNPRTGEKNVVIEYECPKNKWWNSHAHIYEAKRF